MSFYVHDRFIIGKRKSMTLSKKAVLRALAANPARKLDVFRHDRHSLGVNCAKIRVFKEADKIPTKKFA